MKLIKVKDIDKDYVLAKDVYTSDFNVLLVSGTVLKKEYLRKLVNLGIEEVYINDEIVIHEEEIVILRNEVTEAFKKNVRSVLEKHIYSKSDELSVIAETADKIITNILSEEKVIEKVYDIKERDADIYEHSISLCSLSTLTALKLGCDEKLVRDIGVACLLHDLGLRYLTIDYSNRSIDEMSDLEYAEYKKHPVYGYSALKNETWISERSKNIILMHHEHLDGSGYPLRAVDIPLEVKIVSVGDAFDEMICGIGCVRTKVYEAIEYLKTFKGVYFDKSVVSIFLHFTAVYPVGTKVSLNDDRVGIVIKQNSEFTERPIIRIIKDKDGNSLTDEIIIDLLVEHSIFINDVLN